MERVRLFNTEKFMDSVFDLDNNVAKYKIENFKPDVIKKVYIVKTLRKKIRK